jgi:ribosomal protein S13
MCFSNFIGLTKKCNLPAPTSGLYLDMLEGVSLKSVANIAMGDATTAQQLINEKTELVFRMLEEEVYSFLFNETVEHSVESIVSRSFGLDSFHGYDGTRGLRVYAKRGQLTKLHIERLYLLSASDVDDLVITIDDNLNPITKTVNLEAGIELVVELNYSTTSHEVDITYQSEAFEPHEGSISPWDRFYFNGCNSCGCKGIRMVGLEHDDEISAYRGIRADVSLQCDRSKMVCLIAQRSKLAILYLVGAEVMKEAASTDRVNFLSINGKENAVAKAQEWEAKALGILQGNSQGISNYLRQAQSDCFICNNTKYGYSLP